MRGCARLLPLVALLAVGCDGESVEPGVLGEGDWGGEHIAMAVAPSSAVVEFDCAHGSLRLDDVPPEADHFSAAGTFTPETGVVFEGDSLTTVPARYDGALAGDHLTLRVTLPASGEVLGPFHLTRGRLGRVTKCL